MPLAEQNERHKIVKTNDAVRRVVVSGRLREIRSDVGADERAWYLDFGRLASCSNPLSRQGLGWAGPNPASRESIDLLNLLPEEDSIAGGAGGAGWPPPAGRVAFTTGSVPDVERSSGLSNARG